MELEEEDDSMDLGFASKETPSHAGHRRLFSPKKGGAVIDDSDEPEESDSTLPRPSRGRKRTGQVPNTPRSRKTKRAENEAQGEDEPSKKKALTEIMRDAEKDESKYDAESIKNKILELLDKERRLLQDLQAKARERAGVRQSPEAIAACEANFAELEKEVSLMSSAKARLVVVGERGVGKSEVINNLVTGMIDLPLPSSKGAMGVTKAFITCSDKSDSHVFEISADKKVIFASSAIDATAPDSWLKSLTEVKKKLLELFKVPGSSTSLTLTGPFPKLPPNMEVVDTPGWGDVAESEYNPHFEKANAIMIVSSRVPTAAILHHVFKNGAFRAFTPSDLSIPCYPLLVSACFSEEDVTKEADVATTMKLITDAFLQSDKTSDLDVRSALAESIRAASRTYFLQSVAHYNPHAVEATRSQVISNSYVYYRNGKDEARNALFDRIGQHVLLNYFIDVYRAAIRFQSAFRIAATKVKFDTEKVVRIFNRVKVYVEKSWDDTTLDHVISGIDPEERDENLARLDDFQLNADKDEVTAFVLRLVKGLAEVADAKLVSAREAVKYNILTRVLKTSEDKTAYVTNLTDEKAAEVRVAKLAHGTEESNLHADVLQRLDDLVQFNSKQDYRTPDLEQFAVALQRCPKEQRKEFLWNALADTRADLRDRLSSAIDVDVAKKLANSDNDLPQQRSASQEVKKQWTELFKMVDKTHVADLPPIGASNAMPVIDIDPIVKARQTQPVTPRGEDKVPFKLVCKPIDAWDGDEALLRLRFAPGSEHMLELVGSKAAFQRIETYKSDCDKRTKLSAERLTAQQQQAPQQQQDPSTLDTIINAPAFVVEDQDETVPLPSLGYKDVQLPQLVFYEVHPRRVPSALSRAHFLRKTVGEWANYFVIEQPFDYVPAAFEIEVQKLVSEAMGFDFWWSVPHKLTKMSEWLPILFRQKSCSIERGLFVAEQPLRAIMNRARYEVIEWLKKEEVDAVIEMLDYETRMKLKRLSKAPLTELLSVTNDENIKSKLGKKLEELESILRAANTYFMVVVPHGAKMVDPSSLPRAATPWVTVKARNIFHKLVFNSVHALKPYSYFSVNQSKSSIAKLASENLENEPEKEYDNYTTPEGTRTQHRTPHEHALIQIQENFAQRIIDKPGIPNIEMVLVHWS